MATPKERPGPKTTPQQRPPLCIMAKKPCSPVLLENVSEYHVYLLTNYYCFSVALIRDREFCSLINHHVSCSGFTALHYAIVIDNREVVECLLESGADPTIESHRGLTPSDYCTNQEILTLLQQHTVMVTILIAN